MKNLFSRIVDYVWAWLLDQERKERIRKHLDEDL
jgi:hypothetical protein